MKLEGMFTLGLNNVVRCTRELGAQTCKNLASLFLVKLSSFWKAGEPGTI